MPSLKQVLTIAVVVLAVMWATNRVGFLKSIVA